MKILMTLVLLYTASERVSCFAFIDYVSGKLNEVANTVVVTFNDLKNKLKDFFYHKIVYEETPRLSIIERAKKEFLLDVDVINDNRVTRTGYGSVNSDPSVFMSTPQLATLHGKRIESHIVHTKDGYLLTLHRVMSAPERRDEVPAEKTVLLHHGLLGSSADWILLGPDESLPYLLSNDGYDVWMTNARGNIYSRGHTSFKVNSREFWNFTWQEMGEQDLPVTIEYIRSIKNVTEPINYIGHSMGATVFLVLLSSIPKYNEYFRIGVLLAPLAFLDNVEGPIKKLGSTAFSPSAQLYELLGRNEFFSERIVPEWLAAKYCRGPMIYCGNPLFFISGSVPNYEGWSASFVARLLYHVPAGTSTNTILHYAQISNSRKFHRFGDNETEFSLSNVTVPIALISSSEDRLAAVADVLKLYFKIASPLDNYVIRDKNMDHSDLVWGSKAHAVVFDKVIEYLGNLKNYTSTKANEVMSNDIL